MSAVVVRLGASHHATLVGMGRAALPGEACGLILGARVGAETVVVRIAPVPNVSDDSARRFVLDPESMIAAENRADADGLAVVGVVHSHPTSAAVPSATDCADAATYDPAGEWVHLIVSMQGFAPQVRAWQYRGPEEADAVPIEITEDVT